MKVRLSLLKNRIKSKKRSNVESDKAKEYSLFADDLHDAHGTNEDYEHSNQYDDSYDDNESGHHNGEFTPNGRRRRVSQVLGSKLTAFPTHFIPNALTIIGLLLGVFSIIKAMNGFYNDAALLIVAAAFFDGIDGKVARLMNTSSEIGMQLDSLADMVSFGVAPGIMMYEMVLKDYGRVGVAIMFVYVACGALRLARFNVNASVIKGPYFQGLPIPAAACFLSTIVIFIYDNLLQQDLRSIYFDIGAILVTLFLGFVMVSNIPYYSFKKITFDKPMFMKAGFVSIILLAIVIIVPGDALFLSMLLYVVYSPMLHIIRLRRNREEYLRTIYN